jgi:hypothetical protein
MRRLRRRRHKRKNQLKNALQKSKLTVETLESRFLLDVTPDLLSYLRITEIMYNPLEDPGSSYGDDQFEYIELKNISTDVTLDLTDVSFVKDNYNSQDPSDLEGIDFAFAGSDVTSLGPQELVLAVRNKAAFVERYGTGYNSKIAGQYDAPGNALSDNREHLRLIVDPPGPDNTRIIHEFEYNDSWYPVTDSKGEITDIHHEGFSLQVVDELEDDLDEWDNREGWRPSSEWLGTPGEDDVFDPRERPIIINEVMAHSHDENDWVEIYINNTVGAEAINLKHWYLSDSRLVPDPATSELGFTKYQIPNDIIVAAGGTAYVTLKEDDFGFGLSDDGDFVYLYSADAAGNLTGYFEEREFGASETNVSFGRYEKSTSTHNFVAMQNPTPGLPNSDPKVGPIVISEIMYNLNLDPLVQDDKWDYVELTNITGLDIDLWIQDNDPRGAGTIPWEFTDGIDFTFQVGDSIPAFGSILIVNIDPTNPTDLSEFETIYGAIPEGVDVFGPFENDTRLSEGGERLELSKPGEIPGDWNDTQYKEEDRVYIRQDRVNYDDDPPEWPTEPDGFGKSLTRIHNDEYGNDPINWKAADPLNLPPTITTFVDSPDPVALGETLTLAATVSDPGDVVSRVEFYHDANGNNVYDALDSLLGVDTNGADGWNWTGATGGFATGTNRYFVRAQDDDEFWSSTATAVGKINAAPTIDSLTAEPDPVSQTSILTLTAGKVADADGTVVAVKFYYDANGNGQLDDDTDQLFGTDVSSVGGWSWSGSIAGYSIPLGPITYFARAQDNEGAWSDAVPATGTIIPPNDPPTIESLSVSPDPVTLGEDITLTAHNVNDSDGNIVVVAFFRDANGNGVLDFGLDTFLGLDDSGADVGTWTGSTAGFPSNMNTYFACAWDDKSDMSDFVSTTGEIQSPNIAPTIGSLSDSPDPVMEGYNLTLTAHNVSDSDGTVDQVEFYRDTNENEVLDVGDGEDFDTFLGLGTCIPSSSDWSWTGSTAGFGVGQHRYFARAQDDDGEWSITGFTIGQVDPANEAPTVTSLSDSPDPVTQGKDLTLTANGVVDTDGEETIARVEFYRDDGDGVFEEGEDTLLGIDTSSADGWKWTGATTGWAAGDYIYFARAQDDFSAWSEVVSATGAVEEFFVDLSQYGTIKQVTYTDANNSVITIKLKNLSAKLFFDNIDVDVDENNGKVTINGATELNRIEIVSPATGAALTFAVKGGAGMAELGGITGAYLDKLTAKTITLIGDIDLTGYLGAVTLDDISGGVNVTTRQSSPKGFSLKADVVNAGASFDLNDNVSKFQVNRFEDGLLQADHVNKVSTKAGVFGADVIARNGDILNISAVGDITGHLNASNMIKKVAAKTGDFTGVARAGNIIGTIQALNLDGAIISAGQTVQKVNIKNNINLSYILGGYDVGSDGLFGGGDILGSGSVQSVTAKGKFDQSYVAAGVLPSTPDTEFLLDVGVPKDFGEIGKVSFGVVDPLTSPNEFGLYAATDINSVKVKDGPSETESRFIVDDMNG